jgi:hypothetical protein
LLVTNSSNISNRDGKKQFPKGQLVKSLEEGGYPKSPTHSHVEIWIQGMLSLSVSLFLGEIDFSHTPFTGTNLELLASHKQLEYLEQRLKETICNKSIG